jgi:hypothetical protein
MRDHEEDEERDITHKKATSDEEQALYAKCRAGKVAFTGPRRDETRTTANAYHGFHAVRHTQKSKK